MFNVGILAAGWSAPKLVNLTPRQIVQALGGGGMYYSGIMLYNNGVAQDQYADYNIPGEWWIPGYTSGVGASYEARATHLSGSLPTLDRGVGNWLSLTQSPRWGWRVPTSNGGGRILVEIRSAASLSVVASAQFWTQGYAP